MVSYCLPLNGTICRRLATFEEVSPTGFEPVTFGSGGGRRFCPKLNAGKELRQLARGEVLPVVLHCLPLIGAYCIYLHRSRIFGTLPMLSMQPAKWFARVVEMPPTLAAQRRFFLS